MATKTVQDSSLTLVADAIRAKGGTSAQLEFPTDFVSAIGAIPTGGGSSVMPRDVNFYDYDGTIVDSYTASEFAALSAMPANPSHTGLIAQGWNWSLTNAKTYVAKYGKLNIGQMYVTTSGDTEIDIQLGIGRNKPYLGVCVDGTVDIDWGDGSAHDTLTSNSAYNTMKTIQHIYPDTGEPFTIKLHMESGELGFRGDGTSSTGSQVLYNGSTVRTNGQRAYQAAIKAVRLGNNCVVLTDKSFQYCRALSTVTIPKAVTRIDMQAFQYCNALISLTIPDSITYIDSSICSMCSSLSAVSFPEGATNIGYSFVYQCSALKSLTIPEGATSIDESLLNTCPSLSSLVIPEGVTEIGRSAFQGCEALISLTIPKSVTTIESQAFYWCRSLTTLVFKPTTPPTLANAYVFYEFPSDLVVYVPAGTLATYQNATNYTNMASYMQEKSV